MPAEMVTLQYIEPYLDDEDEDSDEDITFSDDEDREATNSKVFAEYLSRVANKGLQRYRGIIQYSKAADGGKEGQSYYTHVLDLIGVVERFRSILKLNDPEMRCVALALTIHDINKIDEYARGANGRELSYVNAATPAKIEDALAKLGVEAFFPEWRRYLPDIVYLARLHQDAATGTDSAFNPARLENCQLDFRRLRSVLAYLMKIADGADNIHSADWNVKAERHRRDRLIQNINAAVAVEDQEYRFIGHRLAELRGLFTNVIHNELVKYFQEKFGPADCLDLLYFPEGVNYLLNRRRPLDWNEAALQEVAARVEKRLAEIQSDALYQFIKARPAGIVVDDAAISSGASVADILNVVGATANAKIYKSEWRDQRNANARADLEEALAAARLDPALKAVVQELLDTSAGNLIVTDQEALRRGEFAGAYRKFLEDHRSDRLKALKLDGWQRVYRLFGLPEAKRPLYSLIDPFRRGYFIARDLPALGIAEMTEKALADLAQLEAESAASAKTGPKTKKTKASSNSAQGEQETLPGEFSEDVSALPTEPGYLLDYLRRNLEIWDSVEGPDRALGTQDWGASLRQYANSRRPHEQCCHCGSPLKADDWMAAQVPRNIGVQSFSNRLEGGSPRDPKRKICPVCRTQFILEKLAWRSHGDKQGAEQTTFYLHLFPYTFFTQPQLNSWWQIVQSLRDSEHGAFFLNSRDYFRQTQTLEDYNLQVRGYRTGTNGLGLPVLHETISNTPVLPIVAVGDNYGLQFTQALETAVILVRWFDCRAILTRSPVPPVNLATQRINNRPVVLMVEGRPRNLSWLVPQTSLYRRNSLDPVEARDSYLFDRLYEKLGGLHRLTDRLYFTNSKTDEVMLNFITAAADNPLALYYEAERLIEKKVAAEKGKGGMAPERQALYLSAEIAPLLTELQLKDN